MLNQEYAIRQRINNLYGNLTDEQLANINRSVDIGIVMNKPLNVGATQHLGIVHGGEYVISAADDKARRKLLDKHYQSEKFTRSTNDDGEVVVTINVPTSENKDGLL